MIEFGIWLLWLKHVAGGEEREVLKDREKKLEVRGYCIWEKDTSGRKLWRNVSTLMFHCSSPRQDDTCPNFILNIKEHLKKYSFE